MKVKLKEKGALLVALVAILILCTLFFATKSTGYAIKDLLRSKCVSNGYQCGDCIDNDGDGWIDYKVNKLGRVTGDPDCSSLTDNTESACIPLCYKNSDCGTNGYLGSPYCEADGNVYRDYVSYTCYNPSTCTALCGNQIDKYIWQRCGVNSTTTCVNGVCV